MLQVQVNYWALQESIKHNRATEEQARNELAETHRHYVTTENETKRHDIATETIAQATLQETIRHDVETENVSWYNATTQRNLADSQIKVNESVINLNQEKAASERVGRYYTQNYLMPESSARTANLKATATASLANAKTNAISSYSNLVSDAYNTIFGNRRASARDLSQAAETAKTIGKTILTLV